MAVLVPCPLIKIGLQFSWRLYGQVVVDTHAGLVNQRSQRSEAGESTVGLLRIFMFPS
jgi:hypothetical protein